MKKKETLIWLLIICVIFAACWAAARAARVPEAPQENPVQAEEAAPALTEESQETLEATEETPAPEESQVPTEETPAPAESQGTTEETPAPAEEAPAPAEAPQETPAEETPAEETPVQAEEPAADWTREGFFRDENGNMVSVTRMEDVDESGWYVGCMLGEDLMDDSYGGVLQQEGSVLKGTLSGWEESIAPISVIVSEDEGDGLLFTVEGGESYRFTPMEMQEAAIFISINTEGPGNIAYIEGEEAPEIDPEYPFQSAQINLAEPAVYTLLAWPQDGNQFVKWTKNGEDFSAEPQITVMLDESADYVAVFEEVYDGQNPVMNFIGEYQCGRAHAKVACFGKDEAQITIEWGGSASELARWDIIGRLDTDTLTVAYSGCTKSIEVYKEGGELVSSEPEYEDGTGTIVFNNDGTFTWHEDQSVYGEDMLFEWIPVVIDSVPEAPAAERPAVQVGVL